MKKMYKGKVNSPQTQIIEDIGINTANIKVLDASVFPDGPNLAVIGNDVQAETIKYDSINNNILVGCVRGFQGKANAWKKDSVISRNFTEYDLNVIQENILELDNNKVDKVDGKDLSSNDFTNEEKNKLANIEGGANKYIHPDTHPASMITETSSKRFVSDTEKQNWNDKIDKSQITDEYYGESSDKIVSQKGVTVLGKEFSAETTDIRSTIHQIISQMAGKEEIPKKLSQLNNDKNFKTESEIQSLINNSTKLKKEVVTSLPATGKEDVIYLLKNKGDTNNFYTEYLWINGNWEIIGDTKVDLTGYLKSSDIIGNLTSTAVNRPLSASMGRYLEVNKLNKNGLSSAQLRTNKSNINVFTDRSTSDHQLGIILGDLELRTEQNKKNIKTKLSEMEEDSTHKTVTDSEKQSWNKKFDLPAGKENQVLTKTTNGAEFKEISSSRSSRSATFVIANYDSSENSKAGADYVIQENESAAEIINSFIAKLPDYGGKIQLTEGNFNINKNLSINYSKNNTIIEGYGDSTTIIDKLNRDERKNVIININNGIENCKLLNLNIIHEAGNSINIRGNNNTIQNIKIKNNGIFPAICINKNTNKNTLNNISTECSASYSYWTMENSNNNTITNCSGTSTNESVFYIFGSNNTLTNCSGTSTDSDAFYINGSGISVIGCFGETKNPNKYPDINFGANCSKCIGLGIHYGNRNGLRTSGTNNIFANNISIN